ncbi:Protein of unknown function [Gryllus bimaculatus]|nr:Protein of unknown function [Gryllus bimaculatus]
MPRSICSRLSTGYTALLNRMFYNTLPSIERPYTEYADFLRTLSMRVGAGKDEAAERLPLPPRRRRSPRGDVGQAEESVPAAERRRRRRRRRNRQGWGEGRRGDANGIRRSQPSFVPGWLQARDPSSRCSDSDICTNRRATRGSSRAPEIRLLILLAGNSDNSSSLQVFEYAVEDIHSELPSTCLNEVNRDLANVP